jgi:hypothetical protein
MTYRDERELEAAINFEAIYADGVPIGGVELVSFSEGMLAETPKPEVSQSDQLVLTLEGSPMSPPAILMGGSTQSSSPPINGWNFA